MTSSPSHPRPVLPIVLQGVSSTSGNKRILKDIDLTLTGDEGLTAVLGPNGAGKSLLLQLVHGLIKGDDGSVTWGGEEDPGLKQQLQTMMFQRPVLLRRSVKANIEFALNLNGIKGDAAANRIDEMLSLTGLTRYMDHPARQLSFGEQQRL